MNALVPSISITNLLQQRDAIIERVNQAVALLKEADQIAKTARLECPPIGTTRGGRFDFNHLTGDQAEEGREVVVKIVDASAWKLLMNESGLMTFMDAKARSDWHTNIYELKVPPLTMGTIEATFTQLHDTRGDMFERGVLNIFRELSWRYKTNSPWLLGKRIIVNRFMESWGSVSSRACDKIDDLNRIFYVLDKKPEPDHRNASYGKVWNSVKAGQSVADMEYLQLKWFKKGTAHITFKRLDLVEQMNQIIVKHYPGALAQDN